MSTLGWIGYVLGALLVSAIGWALSFALNNPDSEKAAEVFLGCAALFFGFAVTIGAKIVIPNVWLALLVGGVATFVGGMIAFPFGKRLSAPNVEKLKAQGDIEGLIASLKYKENPSVRLAAAEALDDLGWQPNGGDSSGAYWVAKRQWDRCVEHGELSTQALIAVLKDKEQSIRKASAETLGRIGGTQAVQALIDALKDADKDVRLTAAEALDALGWQPDKSKVGGAYWVAKRRWDRCIELGESSIGALIVASKDKDKEISSAASGTLKEMGVNVSRNQQCPTCKHWSPRGVAKCLECDCPLMPVELVASFMAIQTSSSPSVVVPNFCASCGSTMNLGEQMVRDGKTTQSWEQNRIVTTTRTMEWPIRICSECVGIRDSTPGSAEQKKLIKDCGHTYCPVILSNMKEGPLKLSTILRVYNPEYAKALLRLNPSLLRHWDPKKVPIW